jgi:hypothetical protein
MHPTIHYGEIIIVEPLGDSTIRSGDILLYRRSQAAIAHRLVRVTSPLHVERPQLVLRGDAADCADPPIGIDQVLGRVIAVERDGRVRRLGVLSRTCSPAVGRALRRARRARATIVAAALRFAPKRARRQG